jgi:hypothetical protein
MHLHDRYALALAMLDGDRDARNVLADLLEEQGERGLAQWARNRNNQNHKRLDLAIMLLPCRAAIHLTTHFIQHGFSDATDVRFLGTFPEKIRKWCTGNSSDERVLAHCTLSLLGKTYPQWGVPGPGRRSGSSNPALTRAIEALVESIKSAINAAQAEIGSIAASTARNWETISANHLRATAGACQNQVVPQSRPPKWRRARSEVDWQIEHAKESFRQLLTSQASPWPK